MWSFRKRVLFDSSPWWSSYCWISLTNPASSNSGCSFAFCTKFPLGVSNKLTPPKDGSERKRRDRWERFQIWQSQLHVVWRRTVGGKERPNKVSKDSLFDNRLASLGLSWAEKMNWLLKMLLFIFNMDWLPFIALVCAILVSTWLCPQPTVHMCSTQRRQAIDSVLLGESIGGTAVLVCLFPVVSGKNKKNKKNTLSVVNSLSFGASLSLLSTQHHVCSANMHILLPTECIKLYFVINFFP